MNKEVIHNLYQYEATIRKEERKPNIRVFTNVNARPLGLSYLAHGLPLGLIFHTQGRTLRKTNDS